MLEILFVGPLLFLLFVFLVIYIAAGTSRNSSEAQKKSLLVSSACLLIATASWIFNFGLIRLTTAFVPIIITGVFYVTNYIAAGCFEYSRRIKVLNLLFVLTYLFTNVLYPDTDFIDSYAFFGLINEYEIVKVIGKIAEAIMLVHIALFVWQVVEICIAKALLRKQRQQAEDRTDKTEI